jgi:glutathione S-transferase
MITVHHLNYSRSTRILWLLEELGEPYEIMTYERDSRTLRAPKSLATVHPLGRAPVIQDGARTLAESGAIIEYLIDKYGHGRLAPARASAEWPVYLEWLHFAEGSAMTWLLLDLLGGFTGGLSPALKAIIDPEIAKTLAYLSASMTAAGFLVGASLTGADIQMFYVLEMARMVKRLSGYPILETYLKALEQRPAYRRAIERGGPVALPIP